MLLTSGSKLAWIGVVPAIWCVGMIFSHIVFGRCVLNEIASRLRKKKKASQSKAQIYKKGTTLVWMRRRPQKGTLDEIQDTMPTPDLDKKTYEAIIHPS